MRPSALAIDVGERRARLRFAMANHKRRRPKNRRAGCLLCKPWKMNGFNKRRIEAEQFGAHRGRLFADRDVAAARRGEFS